MIKKNVSKDLARFSALAQLSVLMTINVVALALFFEPIFFNEVGFYWEFMKFFAIFIYILLFLFLSHITRSVVANDIDRVEGLKIKKIIFNSYPYIVFSLLFMSIFSIAIF